MELEGAVLDKEVLVSKLPVALRRLFTVDVSAYVASRLNSKVEMGTCFRLGGRNVMRLFSSTSSELQDSLESTRMGAT